MEDIKKAFNKFKRDIKKENPEFAKRSFYMTNQQMKNRTATMVATYCYEDDENGGYVKSAGFDKEKRETIWAATSMKEKMEESAEVMNEIKASNAFKKFCESIPCSLSIDTGKQYSQISFYIRFNY